MADLDAILMAEPLTRADVVDRRLGRYRIVEHSAERSRGGLVGLAHNAASPTEYFRLPEDRTVAMGAAVVL